VNSLQYRTTWIAVAMVGFLTSGAFAQAASPATQPVATARMQQFKSLTWDLSQKGRAIDLSAYKQTFNDDFKVSTKLTVTIGLRFDYQPAFKERFNRFSSFDPTAPNPGAGNRPGAIVFASSNNPTFDKPVVHRHFARTGRTYTSHRPRGI